jgi:hypothetical protein
MIISSALLVVWYIQSKQVKGPAEVSFDAALTYIKNKRGQGVDGPAGCS